MVTTGVMTQMQLKALAPGGLQTASNPKSGDVLRYADQAKPIDCSKASQGHWASRRGRVPDFLAPR